MKSEVEKQNEYRQPVNSTVSNVEDFVDLMNQRRALALMVLYLITAVFAVVSLALWIEMPMLVSPVFQPLRIADTSNGSMERITSGSSLGPESTKASNGTKVIR